MRPLVICLSIYILSGCQTSRIDYSDPNYCNTFKGEDKTYCEDVNRRTARMVEIRSELRAAGHDVDAMDNAPHRQEPNGLRQGDRICPATYGGLRDYSRPCYVIERR